MTKNENLMYETTEKLLRMIPEKDHQMASACINLICVCYALTQLELEREEHARQLMQLRAVAGAGTVL